MSQDSQESRPSEPDRTTSFATAKEWIEYAINQGWRHSIEPSVFISFNRADYQWIPEIESFLKGSLDSKICVETGQVFYTRQYADPTLGTARGEQYVAPLIKHMWSCRAAIVVLSQSYMDSKICSKNELPFLVWRHLVQRVPIFVVRAGLISENYEHVTVPIVDGNEQWPVFDLKNCTDDRHPTFNAELSDPTSGKLISQLAEGFERQQRLRAFARRVSEDASGVRPKTISAEFERASVQLRQALPDVRIGIFPETDVFEGRASQLDVLSAVARDPKFSAAGVAEIGGLGKTSLILRFIEELRAKGNHRFEGIFCFTFYGGRTQEQFVEALTGFLAQQLRETAPETLQQKQTWLGDTLRRRAVLLFLDGLEVIQSPGSPDDAGAFLQGPVKILLHWLCQGDSVSSLALLTSRLPFRDLEKFRGSRFLPIPIPGLTPEDGARALRRWGLTDDEGSLQRYVVDLGGHPLGLLAFANSARLAWPGEENAAAHVARDVELAKVGTIEDKVRRMLEYYKRHLSPEEAKVLTSVAVFPDEVSAGMLAQTIEDDAPERLLKATGRGGIETLLQQMARWGVLQARIEAGQAFYTCHPIIRECFRPSEGSLARSAASLQIADRPEVFVPHTLAQARPYLKAIATLTENGDFANAYRIFEQKLGSGALLFQFDDMREMFGCMTHFLRQDRVAACFKELKQEQINEMLPQMTEICLDLEEWELASYYNNLDRQFLRPDHPLDSIVNRSQEARIEAEIGSLEEASRLLGTVVGRRDLEDWATFIPDLAEIERGRGRTRNAVELLREWRADRPRDAAHLERWLSNWDRMLMTTARMIWRAAPGEAKTLMAAVGKSRPVALEMDEITAAYREYHSLSLSDRKLLSREQWQRRLELAELLGKYARGQGMKGGEGGWMIGMIEAYNGLNEPEHALDYARLALSEIHQDSNRRPWIEVEIARAYLLQRRYILARETAEAARRRALTGQFNTARAAAELLQEILRFAPEAALKEEVDRTLQWVADRSLRADEVPDWSPLPGSVDWGAHVTELLLGCVTEQVATAGEIAQADVALRFAAHLGLTTAIEKLIQLGANPRKADASEMTALAYAVRSGWQGAVELLLREQRGLNLSDKYDERVLINAVLLGRSDIVRQLLQSLQHPQPDSLTAICEIVARYGDEELLATLLDFISGMRGSTKVDQAQLLTRAAGSGNLAVVRYLGSRIGLNVASEGAVTALMAAAAGGHLPILDFLADNHVNATARDKNGNTALDCAVSEGEVSSVIRLAAGFALPLDRGRHQLRALVNAARQNKGDEVKRALRLGLRPDERDDRGWTAFVAAARLPDVELLQEFLKITPKVSVDTTDRDGETALMAAAGSGRDAAVSLLLAEGASPGLANNESVTAFDLALAAGEAPTLRMLLLHAKEYLHAGNVQGALATALRTGKKDAIAPILDDPSLEAMIASAVCPGLIVNPEQRLSFLRSFIALRGSKQSIVVKDWPTRHPFILDDGDLAAQKCVVGDRTSATFGRLIKAPAPAEIVSRFLQAVPTDDAMIGEFEPQSLRAVRLPFLPDSWLLLLPHVEAGIEIPFVLHNDDLILAIAVNDWLYEVMEKLQPPVPGDALLAYARFMFAVLVGQLGAFFFVDSGAELPWLEDADDGVKKAFAENLVPLTYAGLTADGQHQLRGTVLFKDALFMASLVIDQNWRADFESPEVVMEELPIHFGRKMDLLVRY